MDFIQNNSKATLKGKTNIQPAGFCIRLCASLIDWIVSTTAGFVPCLCLDFVAKLLVARESIIFIFLHILSLSMFFSIYFAYYACYYTSKGATPGKQLFNLKVIDEDTGEHIQSYLKIFLREFAGKLFSMTTVTGYIMAGIRKDKKALHDLICSTRVIRQS